MRIRHYPVARFNLFDFTTHGYDVEHAVGVPILFGNFNPSSGSLNWGTGCNKQVMADWFDGSHWNHIDPTSQQK